MFMQETEASNKLIFILAASRGLKESMRRYSSYEVEISVVHWALQKVKVYLYGGHRVTVLTDQISLKGLESIPLDPYTSHNTKRAMEDILAFNCKITDIPKSSNMLADFMSRRVHSTKKEPEIPRHLAANLVVVMHAGTVWDQKRVDLLEAANNDYSYADAVECLVTSQQLHRQDYPAQRYKKVWSKLSINQAPNGRQILVFFRLETLHLSPRHPAS